MIARRSRRGMSMLEVMIVIAVLIVISALTFSAISGSIEMGKLLGSRDDTTQGARVAMEKLRRELQLAYLTSQVQAVNSYRTVFVGIDEDPDKLYFATLAHQRLYRDSRECDQTEITIWTEPEPDGKPGYVLYHREAPRVDEEPDEDGTIFPLAHNVRTFNVRYLDGQTGEWVDEWDSRGTDTPNRLPRAIEIGLVLIGTDPDDPDRTVDLPHITTVLLERGGHLQSGVYSGETTAPPAEEGETTGTGTMTVPGSSR